jgi:hypothetical protein
MTSCLGFSFDSIGSVFRDEFDLAILQLQENNRLEILKRKWWEGGKCPKEEDHRAKGKEDHRAKDKHPWLFPLLDRTNMALLYSPKFKQSLVRYVDTKA